MDKQVVRAYLWQAIIRLGFCPTDEKEKKRWLVQYGSSTSQFWGVPYPRKNPFPENGRLKGSIDCTDHLDLFFEYEIASLDKFKITFFYSHPRDKQQLVMWFHDVDDGQGKYFSFSPQFFLDTKQEKHALKSFADDDIKAVVNGLLLHPKAHQHLESPIDNHAIRIGGGIDNPFLYLFHLRYQLCPIPDRRKTEKERLMVVFSDALKNNSPIAANKLMAQPAKSRGLDKAQK